MRHGLIQKILVAGGAGFLGSHLCEKLVAQGHEVLGLTKTREVLNWQPTTALRQGVEATADYSADLLARPVKS